MSLNTPAVPALSGPQRRSHLLLMLFAPLPSLSLVALARYNGEDLSTTRRDLAHIESEIRRIYHLQLVAHHDGSYRIEGTILNRRLCLIEGMRRALRLCADKVNRYFLPLQEQHWLKVPAAFQASVEQIDELVERFTALIDRPAAPCDRAFLSLYLRYSLSQCPLGDHPEFNQHQQQWLRQKAEYAAVADMFRHWPVPPAELFCLTLLSRWLKTPHRARSPSGEDRQLLRAVEELVRRFEQLAGMSFNEPEMLAGQLFSHLSAALERCHFHVGIDNSLQMEVEEKYPRLLRTARAAVMPFEAAYRIRFSREEMGLIAVIFGAWLMQDNDLQEKQVVILTKSAGEQEKMLELQIRELTLLPLNIKFQAMDEFQAQGAPKNTVLVVTSFAMPLPLFSPPLMLVRLPLAQAQQERIRQLLETPGTTGSC
ncbi:stationary phase inducible protein CsiE [Acerihabitans arboris]|uniref:Stationary phase inducible protein CsiE n=1 Tax=Acerihabitans arboris TaxID=2691583 RepID=A0A845SNU5_9GAMM|nr:stationary phase inducible protein CsiE [Acerihabitans arboris]NDL65729.1 stationary phase inducible protein CsiE [Acerihabitans arboris]